MSNFKLTFSLKQHTPIIHFQHDQHGATLRATEMKPKLDRFLIEKMGGETHLREEHPDWFINKDHPALDYKIKIEAFKRKTEFDQLIDVNIGTNQYGNSTLKYKNLSGFFGNMMKLDEFTSKDKHPKKVTFFESIKVIITCFHSDVRNKIKEHFCEFLAISNFGSRQNKGFGSFYIDPIDKNHYSLINEGWFDYKMSIKVQGRRDSDKIITFFEQLDWFYRTLRGGINVKGRNDTDLFYFKSLLFLYFRNLIPSIQWEKKTIKEEFFLRGRNGLLSQQENKPDPIVPSISPLHFSADTKKMVKDMMGLASEESWLSYGRNISKKHASQDGTVLDEKNSNTIQRYKSPLFFKVIRNTQDSFNIYLKFYPVAIKGEWFQISGGGTPFVLQIPNDFNLHLYFEFFMNKENFNISTHVEGRFHGRDEYQSLEATFNNLTKINI